MASPKTHDEVCSELHGNDLRLQQMKDILHAFNDIYVNERKLAGKSDSARFLNKNPHLSNKLSFVNELFPRAQFLWIYRNMMDVVASLKRLFVSENERHDIWHVWPERRGKEMRCWSCYFGERPPAQAEPARTFPGGDIAFLAEYWLECNHAAALFLRTLPEKRWLAISEDELINNPEEILGGCMRFLGVSVDFSLFEGCDIDHSRNGAWRHTLRKWELESLLKFIERELDGGPDSILPSDARLWRWRGVIEEVMRASPDDE